MSRSKCSIRVSVVFGFLLSLRQSSLCSLSRTLHIAEPPPARSVIGETMLITERIGNGVVLQHWSAFACLQLTETIFMATGASAGLSR